MSEDNLLEILRNNGDLNDVKPNPEFIDNIITEPANNELKRCPFCGAALSNLPLQGKK